MDSIERLKGRKTISFWNRGIGLLMPTPPQTVSIIGSVKNPSTVVYRPGLGLDDYLRQAGGMTEDANKKEMYVMRANGTTDSSYLAVKTVQSGDTIVVPQKIEAQYASIGAVADGGEHYRQRSADGSRYCGGRAINGNSSIMSRLPDSPQLVITSSRGDGANLLSHDVLGQLDLWSVMSRRRV